MARTAKQQQGATIIYCRVSTEEQANEGFGLRAQEHKCRLYAELHGFDNVRVVRDEGYTGSNTNRPGLQAIIRACEAGEIAHVVVSSLDRLSRSTLDTLRIVTDVFDGHVAFHSIRETLDTSSATGRFALTMFSAVAQLDRDLIAERTSAALQQKVRQGERVGRAPLGYRGEGDGPEGAGELVEVAEEQAILREIMALRAEGWGYKRIADRLREENVPTKRGGRWEAATVHAVVRRAERVTAA